MSIITMPTTLLFAPESTMGQARFDVAAASPETGTVQARVLAPPKWTLALMQPDRLRPEEAGQWRAMAMSLSGRVNVLAAYDPNRRLPNGTARGSCALRDAVSAGASSAVMAGLTAGVTLVAGDLVQIGTGLGTSALVEVATASTADGAGEMAITFHPPIRPGLSFAIGATCTLEHARGYFRRTGSGTSWATSHGGTMVTGLSVDLIESWA